VIEITVKKIIMEIMSLEPLEEH